MSHLRNAKTKLGLAIVFRVKEETTSVRSRSILRETPPPSPHLQPIAPDILLHIGTTYMFVDKQKQRFITICIIMQVGVPPSPPPSPSKPIAPAWTPNQRPQVKNPTPKIQIQRSKAKGPRPNIQSLKRIQNQSSRAQDPEPKPKPEDPKPEDPKPKPKPEDPKPEGPKAKSQTQESKPKTPSRRCQAKCPKRKYI